MPICAAAWFWVVRWITASLAAVGEQVKRRPPEVWGSARRARVGYVLWSVGALSFVSRAMSRAWAT